MQNFSKNLGATSTF